MARPDEIRVPTPDEILDFWFGDALEDAAELAARVPRWFGADDVLTAGICGRFSALPDQALAGELDSWRTDPRHCVALILVLDQFPRNLHRGKPSAFAYDARALEVSLSWIEAGGDRAVEPALAVFGYLPLEHAEDLSVQQHCLRLFRDLATRVPAAVRGHFDGFASFADRHLAVIARFGRFPHRNDALGREWTQEERVWFEDGGDRFGG